MTPQPWAAQLPSAVPLSELLSAADQTAGDGAFCVFAPSEAIAPADRRGYAALVIAYSRFEEPVAILDDGACLLLIRGGGLAAAAAAARRVLTQAGRLGLATRLRVGVAQIVDGPDDALRTAQGLAGGGLPGEVAGAA